MSQPPSSPYGPGQGPSHPYGAPNVPAYGQLPGMEPPPKGMSNKAKFWIGAVLALPALFLGGVVLGAAGALTSEIDQGGGLTGIVQLMLSLLLLVGYVMLIVVEKTRWIALGMLAGAAILFILAAGACVVLLIAITNSYS